MSGRSNSHISRISAGDAWPSQTGSEGRMTPISSARSRRISLLLGLRLAGRLLAVALMSFLHRFQECLRLGDQRVLGARRGVVRHLALDPLAEPGEPRVIGL